MRGLILLTFFHFLFALCPAAAQVQDGNIDLSAWNPAEGRLVSLGGTWKFLPKRFIAPEEVGQVSDLNLYSVQVPGNWKEPAGSPVSHSQEPAEWGTYILHVKGLAASKQVLGFMIRADSAYRVLLFKDDQPSNARTIVQVGKPGTSLASTLPQIADPIGRFWIDESGDYTILVHIANFHWSFSGIWNLPRLGDVEQLTSIRENYRMADIFVFGMLVIMMLYNISLYSHRKEDHTALYLAAYIATQLGRLMAMSCLGYHFFPNPNEWVYEISRKLEVCLTVLSTYYITAFLYSSFVSLRFPAWLRVYHWFSVILIVVHLATRSSFYSKLLMISQIAPLIIGVYCLFLVIRARRQRKTGAVISIVGSFSLYCTAIFDVMCAIFLIDSHVFYVPFGLVVFNFCQTQVISALFARAFRTAERLGRTLAAEVSAQTREIRSMLDHIPEGVFTIVSPGVIHSNFSAHMRKIFKNDEFAGKNAVEFVFGRSTLNGDQISRIQSTINLSLGEPVVAFDMNTEHLVHEIILVHEGGERKNIQVQWNPILDQREYVEKILVTLKDITELKKLEQAHEAQKNELDYISEITNVRREQFEDFMSMSFRLVEEGRSLLMEGAMRHQDLCKVLFINIHTIKGTARSYGLTKMTGILHELEELFASQAKNPELQVDRSLLIENLKKIADILGIYESINIDKLGRSRNDANKIMLDRSDLEYIYQSLSHVSVRDPSLAEQSVFQDCLRILEKICFDCASQVVAELFSHSERIARDLGKEKPTIKVPSPKIRISFRARRLFHSIFVHLLRNSLDHGIESAAERTGIGKRPQGTIEINIVPESNKYLITYADDGRGLDLRTLEAIGLARGWLEREKRYSSEQIGELIFQNEISTSQSVSEISGRGIGMNAVRQYIEEVGGSITIRFISPQNDKGFRRFRFEILLPAELFLVSKGDFTDLIKPGYAV